MIEKILYIGSKYEYNLRENGEALNKKAFHDNFVKLGYQVSALFFEDAAMDFQEKIIFTADHFRPDLIFFVLQKEQVSVETLINLKQKGHLTVNWFGDDHWRFSDFTARFAPHFSACITTHKFSIDKYKSRNQHHVIRSEWASLTSTIDYSTVDYEFEVSFVGGANAYRQWFVKELINRGIDVACFGARWPNGRVSYQEMEHIFCASKINLSISNSTQYDARYLMASPRNIVNTLRSNKNGSHVKARNFEIPMNGGFQLTEYAPCLEDYFTIGQEISCYRDIDDAEVLINYYLNNNEERETIRSQGVQVARRSHDFLNRIEQFMLELNSI